MPSQPRLLHRVFRFAERPEHAVGDAAQVPAVGLEQLVHGVGVGHGHILLLRFVIQITNDIGPM
jgi:hypothetical protein